MKRKLFPEISITKKELSQLACVHINTIAKWCRYSYPALIRTGYKPGNRILTPEQINIIWEITRNKNALMYYRKAKKQDERLWKNDWLFPIQYPRKKKKVTK
jgi:hypothetical protein